MVGIRQRLRAQDLRRERKRGIAAHEIEEAAKQDRALPTDEPVQPPERTRTRVSFQETSAEEGITRAHPSHVLRRNSERVRCAACGASTALLGRASLSGPAREWAARSA